MKPSIRKGRDSRLLAAAAAVLFLAACAYAGAFLYVISAVLNILLLRRLDYSVVLPLTSLTYVWTMILSSVLLRETITKKQIMGVFLILVGAVLIGVS